VDFDAALRFKDETSGLTAALAASANVALRAAGAFAATGLRAQATLEGRPGEPARTLKLTADEVAFEPATQTLRTTGLATDVAGIEGAWELTASGLAGNAQLEGSVNVAAAPLAAVFDALDWPPPAGLSRGELGAFDLTTRFEFRAEPRSVALSELTLAALGLRVQGSGALTGESALAGRLEIPEFAPSPAVQALLRSAVPPTVDVGALGWLGIATRFEADLATGRAALRDLKASALGATVSANLEAIPGTGGNTFRGSVTTSRFPADAFAKAFAALLPPNLAASELGAIELNTRFEFDTRADSVAASPFAAELFGVRATGDIVGRNVSTAARWTGSAKVTQFSPQDLLKRFGLPPQPTSDPKALTRATLDTRFDVDKAHAELTDIVLVLDESRITGRFTLAGFDKPAYRFALNVDRVDADRYLPPSSKDSQAGEATAGDIELPENNTMNLDGTMQVGALALAGLEFQDVASRIVIANGDMTLDGARARLYGGAFNGTFRVHAAGPAQGLALDGHATAIDLAPLIQDLTGDPANFSGKANFDLSLAGTGHTVIANVGSAAGNVSFKMEDGAVKGFNLARTLCGTYNATQKVPGPAGGQPKQTDYQTMQGTATVKAGTARTEDLLARTSFMDIYGSGTLTLVEQRLDFDLDAKLTGKITIPGCQTLDPFIGDALPFDIHGTVTDPTIRPDFSKLAQRKLREEAQDRLKDKLRDILR
jgi:AsmA family